MNGKGDNFRLLIYDLKKNLLFTLNPSPDRSKNPLCHCEERSNHIKIEMDSWK